MDRIGIVIIDDHEMVRAGLRAFIAPREKYEILGEANSGELGLRMAVDLKPDVILLDLVMPGMNGIETTKKILTEYPQARILIVTSFSHDDKVMDAINSGALGYILKDSSPQELDLAIQAVARGESFFAPSVAKKLIRQFNNPQKNDAELDALTAREMEVLEFIKKGFTNQQIAKELCLSPWTVRSHVSHILQKLNLENRTQAALYALNSSTRDSQMSDTRVALS